LSSSETVPSIISIPLGTLLSAAAYSLEIISVAFNPALSDRILGMISKV